MRTKKSPARLTVQGFERMSILNHSKAANNRIKPGENPALKSDEIRAGKTPERMNNQTGTIRTILEAGKTGQCILYSRAAKIVKFYGVSMSMLCPALNVFRTEAKSGGRCNENVTQTEPEKAVGEGSGTA